MSAAYDYEDLHHLVDRLTPEQVRRVRLMVTRLWLSRSGSAPTGSPRWIAGISGRCDRLTCGR